MCRCSAMNCFPLPTWKPWASPSCRYSARCCRSAAPTIPPWLARLLNDKPTALALRELLKQGRSETYRNTYGLLRHINEV